MIERADCSLGASGNDAPSLAKTPVSIGTNFAWVLAGNTAYAICQWGILVLLARLGTPQMVGTFSLGLAMTAPVMILANLQLRPVLATDVLEAFQFEEYFGLRFITTVLALIAIALMVVVEGYKTELALTIIFIGAGRGFESISEIFHGLLQKHERMDRIGKSMLIRGPVVLAAMAFALLATGKVLWAAAGFALAPLLLLVLYDLQSGVWILTICRHQIQRTRMATQLGLIWKGHSLRRLAFTAGPLAVVATLASLNANVPRYLISWYLGERDLGIFASIAYILIAIGNGAASLGQALTPRLATYFSTGNKREFSFLLMKAIAFGTAVGSGGIILAAFCGSRTLSFLYGREYAEHADAFLWMMIASCLWCVALFLGCAATAARRFFDQVPLLVAVVFGTYIGCRMLIPHDGITGAAKATAIGFAFQTIGSMAICGIALFQRKTQPRACQS